MNLRRFAAAVIAVSVLTGCSGVAAGDTEAPALTEEEQREAAFLDLLTTFREGEDPVSISDADALKEAYQVCGALERGEIGEDDGVSYYMDHIWDGTPGDDGLAPVLMGYSKLCPDWFKG